MPEYLVWNRHLLVEWGRNLCLGHRHSRDLPAIEPQKHQFSARTSLLLLALVMKLLELLESMESEERPNGGFYKSKINNIKLAAFKQCIPYNCLSAFKMQMQKWAQRLMHTTSCPKLWKSDNKSSKHPDTKFSIKNK